MRYRKNYAQQMTDRKNKGYTVSEAFRNLKDAGVDDETINKFAYEIALTSYNEVLYRISDPCGADYDLEDEGNGYPRWRLKEVDSNGNETERFVPELHDLVPHNWKSSV